ncbi:BadF/BadG/BcrA/BcrD ATPase family protein [Nonomuraea sp. NPDC050310]|uniref:N-acetylglucosamine kinase n=1 Tax=unclassified Nonomuraea TaxID=2593643 RepID=UPI0033DB56FD
MNTAGRLLAVDGGNSKTDVALVAMDGSVLATVRGGGFDPGQTGLAPAVDRLEEAVRRAAGPGAAPPYAGHVAAYLANADFPEEEAAIAAELAGRGLAGSVTVGNDTFALLRAGAANPWGVAVVCGAGMNAVGVSPTGQVARFPALGALSGDWGGGLDLGTDVLWHAVRAEDGRGPDTVLTELVKERFGVATVLEVVLELHAGRIECAGLQVLAPGLFEVAQAGDAVARSIVGRQAAEVVAMAEVCLRRLDLLDTPAEVVLGGGVLAARHPLLEARLEEEFARRAPQAKPVVADLPPLAGAALLGLEHLGAGETAKARLRAHFQASR